MLRLADSPLYLTHSGWNALLPKREPSPPLTSDIKVKYLVVGAGYAGLSTARRLLELDPQSRIAVLDAGVVGEGASGRNSGFMQPVRPSDAGEQFRRLAESGRKATSLVLGLIEEYGIDCGLERAGSLRCAATARGEAELRGNAKSYEANGLAYEFLDREEVSRRIGTDYYDFALFAGDGYFVQPAALIRGYADILPSQVELHEKTRVTSLRRDGDWVVSTSSGGTVRAEVVVLAVNSFARQLGYLKDRAVAVHTYAALTPRLEGERVSALGEDPIWGVVPALKYGTTMRRTRDGRLMVRSLYSYEHERDPASIRKELMEVMRKRYPKVAETGFEHVWGGIISITLNGGVNFGQIEPGLYTLFGCNGSGILKFTLLGQYMAEEIAGEHRLEHVVSTYGAANRMPPEPFRSIGFQARTAFGKWQAGKDG